MLPPDAPATKVAQAEAAGARIVMGGAGAEERLELVGRIHTETGYAVIDAYDHRTSSQVKAPPRGS